MAVDPARLPATHRMGEKLASPRGQSPVRATQVALGGAERVDQGGARIPTIQPARLGEGARRVDLVCLALNIKRMGTVATC